MPYLDASRADLQRSHGLADVERARSCSSLPPVDHTPNPDTREVMERTALVEVDGRRVWVIFVFGGAMATDERQRMHEGRDTLVQAALVTAAQASSIGAVAR